MKNNDLSCFIDMPFLLKKCLFIICNTFIRLIEKNGKNTGFIEKLYSKMYF